MKSNVPHRMSRAHAGDWCDWCGYPFDAGDKIYVSRDESYIACSLGCLRRLLEDKEVGG